MERDNFQAWGKSTRRGDKEFICKGNVTKPHTIQQDINQILDKKSKDNYWLKLETLSTVDIELTVKALSKKTWNSNNKINTQSLERKI